MEYLTKSVNGQWTLRKARDPFGAPPNQNQERVPLKHHEYIVSSDGTNHHVLDKDSKRLGTFDSRADAHNWAQGTGPLRQKQVTQPKVDKDVTVNDIGKGYQVHSKYAGWDQDHESGWNNHNHKIFKDGEHVGDIDSTQDHSYDDDLDHNPNDRDFDYMEDSVSDEDKDHIHEAITNFKGLPTD